MTGDKKRQLKGSVSGIPPLSPPQTSSQSSSKQTPETGSSASNMAANDSQKTKVLIPMRPGKTGFIFNGKEVSEFLEDYNR